MDSMMDSDDDFLDKNCYEYELDTSSSHNENMEKSRNNLPQLSRDGQPKRSHLDVLLKCFGHSEFRPMQWQIIQSILEEKRDNCAVMATGYGKSLCYQYPAVFSNGLSIVISPLISLMEDQVQSLEVANIPACFLGSAQNKKGEVIDDLMFGNYRLVYMTPEYASGEAGLELLPRLHKALHISVLAIDEAHCVSQWGHDFRPAYRSLGKVRMVLPTVPILAVTATATEDVKNDIIKSLRLRNPQVLCSGFDRPNIYFKVQKKSADPYADVSKVLTSENKIFNIANGSVIIYCLTKKNTESIVEVLKAHGLKCESYHAGLSIKVRMKVHEQFLRDEIKIIVATIAFGMGIDKPNVRCVIHYGSSSDMEGYYQEAGRAGRDGNPSLCILYHSPADFVTHNFLRESSCMSSSVKEHKETLNAVMKRYISIRDCRRECIISYFQKDWQPPATHMNCCDNCTRKLISPKDSAVYEGIDSQGLYDFTDDTEKFLKAVDYFKPRAFGVGMIVAFLKGSRMKKLNPECFMSELHGSGSSKSEIWWKEIALLLEQSNFISKESRRIGTKCYPVVVLDKKGIDWLRHKSVNKHKPVLLPPTEDIVKSLKIRTIKPLFSGEWTSKEKLSVFSKDPLTQTLSNQEEVYNLNEYAEALFQELCTLRHSLAQTQGINPHTIASDTALKQMAVKRPFTINQLSQGKFDGLSLTKIEKFGDSFINAIKKYVHGNQLPVKTINELLLEYPLQSNHPSTFNATQKLSIDMFNEGMKPDDIANSRKLAISTIITHLTSGLRTSNKIDLNRLISASKLASIIKIIQSPPVNNNMNTLSLIKNNCPPTITYDDIKISIAYLEVRNHLTNLNLPYKDDHTLNHSDHDVEYKSSTVSPFEEVSNITDLSKYELSEKESLKMKHISDNPSLLKSDNIDKTCYNKSENVWDGDDLFSQNIDELDQICDTISKESNNSDEIPKVKNILVDNQNISSISQLNIFKFPDVVPSLHNKEIVNNTEKISFSESGKSFNPITKSDDVPLKNLKKSEICFIDDSDSDDGKQKSENSTKRKLPSWMNETTKANSNRKNKIAKSRFLD